MHNERGPLPGPLGLEVFPKVVFELSIHIVKTKDTLLGDKGWCNTDPLLLVRLLLRAGVFLGRLKKKIVHATYGLCLK